MKITTLLPLSDNQGRPFPDDVIENVLRSFTLQFHGCSTDGRVKVRSVDFGVEHQDESLRVTVVCSKERLEEIRLRIIEIGRELGQMSMYFEVRDYDGVQVLHTAP